MATKTLYTCPYCKAGYETPGDLARCILTCEEKKKLEEETAKKAKLAAEKEAHYKEVLDAYDKFEELRSKYVSEYGSFTFRAKCEDGDLCDWIFRHMGLI